MIEAMCYCISGKPPGMFVMASDSRVLFVVPGSGSESTFVAKNLWTLFGLCCMEITLVGILKFLLVLNEYGAPPQGIGLFWEFFLGFGLVSGGTPLCPLLATHPVHQHM